MPLCTAILFSLFASQAYALSTTSDGKSHKRQQLDSNKNGSTFLWMIEDTYAGSTFFDGFNFFSDKDPKNGNVKYVNASEALSTGLAYVTDDNHVIMKGDQWTQLKQAENRKSVRIESKKVYNTGLFILDLNKAPWGCAIQPAFGTVGQPESQWPYLGEIDIIEGVDDNEHNQVTFHTGPGCMMTDRPVANFSGNVVYQLDCNSLINNNTGCGVSDWSRASYGPYFEAQGGGVFAMKWDENSISVWIFYRAAIPRDILAGTPNPSLWSLPSATLDSAGCNLSRSFLNQSIVFDITFCGDWAGNSYATSGCPGTCEDRLMDPNNFKNATWDINSVKVYQKWPFPPASVRNNAVHLGSQAMLILLGFVILLML